MTPKEAYDYLKITLTLPKGAVISLQKDKVIVGSNDANFVIQGDLLSSEESVMLAVKGSFPHLQDAIEETAAQKAAAVKAEADIKAQLAAAKRRKPALIKL